jgi:hypothetical protein
LHLVCRNLHQIANLHLNGTLCFWKPKPLESLVQSSRIFQDLIFLGGPEDSWLYEEKFGIIEEYLEFTGGHIKTLQIRGGEVDQMIVQRLLDLLPNLESLVLYDLAGIKKESFKWNLKSTKIQCIKLSECAAFESLLESLTLEKCAIKELNFMAYTESPAGILQKFLGSQEKNLKKLTIKSIKHNLVVDLKNLRLEYLDCSCSRAKILSLEFLKQSLDLRHLSLWISYLSAESLNLIWELEGLESLKLYGWPDESSCMDNLHRLGKLRRLVVGGGVRNILDHMKFGVFEDLRELDACFDGASVESIDEMKRITPNLKKLRISSTTSSVTVNALLGTLETLELVKICDSKWKPCKYKYIHQNIKYLDIECKFKFTAEQLTKQFPNLEFLNIDKCLVEVTESFFVTLLSGLKQLKTLYMKIWTDLVLDPESVLQCFLGCGKNLGDASILFRSHDWTVQSFAIEKPPKGSFCVNKTGYWIHGWMHHDF